MAKALIESGASTSCCISNWYRKHQIEIGPLVKDKNLVVGVGNVPINVDGRTDRVSLE